MFKGFCITLALLAFAVVAAGAECPNGQCAAPRKHSNATAAEPSTRGHHHRRHKRHHHERRGLFARRHCCR